MLGDVGGRPLYAVRCTVCGLIWHQRHKEVAGIRPHLNIHSIDVAHVRGMNGMELQKDVQEMREKWCEARSSGKAI